MAQTITVNGVDRSGIIPRGKVTWAESAYLCEVGTGKVVVDDVVGNIVIPGWKPFSVEQSSSTPSRIASGFVGVKRIRYGRDSGIRPPGREIEFATLDLNDLVRRLVIRGKSAKRGKESIGTRLAWLLASEFLAPFVADFGAVTYPDEGLDKDDLRGKMPGDLLVQWAKIVGFNSYIRYKPGESLAELVFRDDNASAADTCTISISNYPGEADADTVFAPLEQPEPELTQDPEDVYSGAYGAHARGHVYETRAATAAAFTERDGITEDSGADNDATASRDARRFLHESKDEEQSLPVAIRVPDTKVGLIQAGMRIPTRMQHMTPEGWNPARYARILRLKRTQPLGTDDVYDVQMDLSPQEAGPAASGLVQRIFFRGGQAGATGTFPNPPTLGNHLIAIISTKLDPAPQAPNTVSTLPRWGGGAWTRLNGATKSGATAGMGLSAFWKEVDSTDREGYISEQNPACAVFEIAGGDPASAVILDVDEAIGGPNYDLGTQTPAAGEVAIAAWGLGPLPGGPWEWAWDYSNSFAWQTPDPNPGISAGWTLGYSKWVSDTYSRDAFLPHSPWTVFAFAEGSGSALLARVTPGESGHAFGGLYIVIPPA